MTTRTFVLGCVVAVTALPIGIANALPPDELGKFDINHDKKLDVNEVLASRMHENAIIAALDTNFDGKVSAAELAQVEKIRQKELHRLRWERIHFARKYGKNGMVPIADYATDPKAPEFQECDSQEKLYIRRDKADISPYAEKPIDTTLSKGASASVTNDNVKSIDTANINAVASYVVARDPCVERDPEDQNYAKAGLARYAIAPWLLLQGQLNDSAKDKSTARIGIDMQAAVTGGDVFENQIFTASPYYQTDFDLEASAYGVNATWEPYFLDLRLGGRDHKPVYLDFWWRLIAEADLLYVDNPGETDLKANTEHAWIGGTAQAKFGFLPKLLDNRLYGVAEIDYFWDAVSGRDVEKYSGEIGLNLNKEGSTSVSVQYAYGTNKSDLADVDQVTLNLNFKQ